MGNDEGRYFSRLDHCRIYDRTRESQQVVEPFIVDFLAQRIALVVEVDGDVYHATRFKADAARERKLVRAGYTVLCLPASLVERDLPRAVQLVRDAIARLS